MEEQKTVSNDTPNVEVEAAPEAEVAETEIVLEETQTEEVDVAKLQEQNKRLYARLKKLEAKTEVKAQVKEEVKPQISNSEQSITRDEVILLAKGYEEDEISKLKAIAKGSGVSLSEAAKDDMFVLWRESKVEEAKKAKSKLGASKGSGSVKAAKSISEMTEAEHRELVNKSFNQ